MRDRFPGHWSSLCDLSIRTVILKNRVLLEWSRQFENILLHNYHFEGYEKSFGFISWNKKGCFCAKWENYTPKFRVNPLYFRCIFTPVNYPPCIVHVFHQRSGFYRNYTIVGLAENTVNASKMGNYVDALWVWWHVHRFYVPLHTKPFQLFHIPCPIPHYSTENGVIIDFTPPSSWIPELAAETLTSWTLGSLFTNQSFGEKVFGL